METVLVSILISCPEDAVSHSGASASWDTPMVVSTRVFSVPEMAKARRLPDLGFITADA